MTEKGKMLAGMLYDPSDSELTHHRKVMGMALFHVRKSDDTGVIESNNDDGVAKWLDR